MTARGGMAAPAPRTPRIACFGEILLRLGPAAPQPLWQGGPFDVHVGGAEANVAVTLAGFGDEAAIISAVPASDLGEIAIRHLRAAGVDCRAVLRAPGRMGLYFLESGAGMRSSAVIYDRAHSSFAALAPGDIDWAAVLDGVDWFHLSGITPALGATSAALALEGARAARYRDIPVSFDGNYRPTLWAGREAEAPAILHAVVAEANCLIGNHRDIALLLGADFDPHRDDCAARAAAAAFAAFPYLSVIASTSRTIDSVGGTHSYRARIDTRGAMVETGDIVIRDIVDRIGTGDAFAAGIIHGLVAGGRDFRAIADEALALAALKHWMRGDSARITSADIAAWQDGGDVRR